ncbi:MAG: putative sulfate/molybdate transporter [Candidatus Omnitrophica bacterium]|nr:putative sulfate/molybdate transporter [Candidatus Omnitrophota bacterium]
MKFSAIHDIRFDRNELAGAFGDIGTDFPLIIGMIIAAKLDPSNVFIMFGLMQILTGVVYKRPMAVQPLKAMAAIIIAQKITSPVIAGAALAIGAVMFILTLTGLIDWIAKTVPKAVVRGIQFGLGLTLGILALKDYVVHDGMPGYILAGLLFVVVVMLWGNRKCPASLIVIGLGIIYGLLCHWGTVAKIPVVSFKTPAFFVPGWADVCTGFFILALPQIPLSIGNSVLATKQLSQDIFPEKPITVRKIGFTYSLMNLINAFFSGIPTCHGSGGMAGHYAFGARTGGSVIIYGTMYLIFGMFFSTGLDQLVKVFPFPALGIILFFESLALMFLLKDISNSGRDLMIALMVGLIACGMKNGFLIGLLVGTLVFYIFKSFPQKIENCKKT